MKIGLIFKINDQKSERYSKMFKDKYKGECGYLSEGFIPDLIVAFGGDGTILKAVDYAVKYNAKIVSVNTGKLGFLSGFDNCNLDLIINSIENDLIVYEQKNLMVATYNKQDYLCLNEVVIQRTQGRNIKKQLINLQLFLDDKLVDVYNSDGLIIATPTGSTAYSLSAGGAILSPDLNGFVVTAICPHSLHNRPIVYNDNSIATVFVKGNNSCLYCDGNYVMDVLDGEFITIKKSEKRVFISKGSDFYLKLNKKLNFWGDNRG